MPPTYKPGKIFKLLRKMMLPKSFLLLTCAITLPFAPAIAQPAPGQLAASRTAPDIGAFPYLSAPQDYRFGNAKTLSFEQKYVFPGGKVQTVEGPYFHADIFADGGAWNQTLLLRDLERQIIVLGGVRMFDGTLPEAARVMINKNAPRFVADLYDPWPYRFRQYLVRTPEKHVWIEIGYGYNAEMFDLTVIEEDQPS